MNTLTANPSYLSIRSAKAIGRICVIVLTLLLISCTTVLVRTTGTNGIQEDPTKRTAGAIVEDRSIQTKVVVNMKSQQPLFRQTNFDVISHNGVVLLVGQVATQTLKDEATNIASVASQKIKRVHNELEIQGNTTFLSRGNDSWISTKVRTQMLANSNVPSGQIRVFTENATVYLMGIISQNEGDVAANLARNVSGVRRVVKVFEYLN
ncbi:MAG: phospholipid-binding protein [SAR86 cluster bacterium]|uniref:Phospholipid-binding protein n=1 Tax=SAR86 cluster bacterium TaxID=2030880 RepID=A0A2A4MQK3_9GAMM|nr:MAG: phospholipid-binding protein [SAR86 cluster bacterium]